MNKLLLCLLCAVAVFAVAAPCLADTVNGVLAEEQVINLPQDSAKWYVSVVGIADDSRYLEVLGWFNTNPNLAKLKKQVHFCRVTSDQPIYSERYEPNVKGLPTVRVQDGSGVVIYESAGKNIPMTARSLYSAIASSVRISRGLLPVLPWRRDMEKRCPGPCPKPTPEPGPNVDPEPAPIDDGGAPALEEPAGALTAAAIIAIALACVIVGSGVGLAVQWKRTYAK